jgi:hypothetical protein
MGVTPETVLEEQYEVVVVGTEHAVVKGLPVVGVRTRLQEQPGESDGVGVPGLALFAVAEHTCEHRKGGGQGVPKPAVVGVGTGVKKQSCRPQRGRELDAGVVAGVCLVKQR